MSKEARWDIEDSTAKKNSEVWNENRKKSSMSVSRNQSINMFNSDACRN